ncbi:MAG TPA: alpha-mannosidase [Candidatus Dormibacteraeota bacterium]|nr:alpha-mannosidase [Candidatus Dormibacteraeota bacterium]
MTEVPLELTAFMVRGEPISYADAMRGDYVPIGVGDSWGPPWSTTWFRVRGRVPDEWAGRSVVASLDLGYDGPTGFTCEALAWKDGRPWRGVDPNHRRLVIDTPEVDFYLEAAANPRAAESGPEPAESMIALRQSAEPAFVLRQASLAIRDQPVLAMSSLSTDHEITAVGHAHIDTAWEWPVREAKRKVARSWSTQLALMDEHPDYVFAASQPVHYAWMKESYPDLYRRIREKVAAGQWEPVGAMWVEADCNLPSGESLVRQMLHGKRFFMREFGHETKIAWLPDVFGYPGNLPQLISSAGCDFFLTQKLSWNDTNKPEHHTFWWEGIDGTRVFTHFPPADTYNGDFSREQLEHSARNFKDADRSNRSLYLFGWGDGGGGPTEEMVDSAHALGVVLGRAGDFFLRASAEAADLATVKGELYFELHRGTYTTQAETKRLNRRAEQALRQAETWSVAAGTGYPAATLEAAWKELLLNQFHDILPGSSIDWVYEEANRDLGEVARVAADLVDTAILKIGGPGDRLTVFNVNSHHRREVMPTSDGYAVVDVPPCGWSVRAMGPEESLGQPVEATESSLENGILRVEWDADGLLTSIWDKEAQREVLGGPGNLFQLHEDNPKRWDAWDLDAEYRDSVTDLTSLSELQVKRTGGLRGGVLFRRRFGHSSLSQLMKLDAGSRVLQFETQVAWEERHRMLKVAFPVTVMAREATYEIQFGHLARPTHSETSQARAMFEVCAQRWADLGDGDYGVALLNDCKYGYDIRGSVMRLSLLRAPTHPDPTADRGMRSFTYALMPHRGDFRRAGVIEAAEDLNAPLRPAKTGLAPGTSRSLIGVDTRQVVIEAVKRAEDSDAVIVRLYEAWGEECHARIRTTMPARRVSICDLLEREGHEVPCRDGELELDLTPSKVVTLKLEA